MQHHPLTTEMQYAKWLFLGPALIHAWWGRCVLLSERPLKTTGLYDINLLATWWGGDDRAFVGLLLIGVSVMALASIVAHRRWPTWSLLLLVPQQLIMVISAFTAWRCIHESRFADGLPYDSLFISADQCYVFIIGVVHTALIVHVYIYDGALSWMRRVFRLSSQP